METTLFRLPDDGWYNIAIAGDFPHAAGYIQVLDEDAMRSMAGEIHGFAADAAWPGILVDFDHQSLDLEKPSTAAGWIVDAEYRPSGLWAKIRWSSKGREALEGGTFRFISPVWTVGDCEELGDKRLRPRHLMNCAVTNCPNIRGMVPLSNREPQGERLTVPARPLGLLRVEPPRMRSWAALANRSQLSDGMRVLANASSGRIRSDEELKAIFAKRYGGSSSAFSSSLAYPGASVAAADNAAASATSDYSGAEDLTPYFSQEALADVNKRYNLGLGYDGRAGSSQLSAAARIRQLEMDRESLKGLLRDLPTAPATKRINIQQARRLAMQEGWDVLDVVAAAKRHNEQVADYNRERFRIKKEYKGKAGLDAALNALDRRTLDTYLKEVAAAEKHNDRINLRINDINAEIAKVASDERSRIDKLHDKEDDAKRRKEEKAAENAARLKAAQIRAESYAKNQQTRADARANAARTEAQGAADAAAIKAKSEQERSQAKAEAKAAESDKRRQAYAESATGLRNYYDFVRSGNFEAADKLYPNVNHAETKSYLDKLTTSQAFTSKSSGFQQAILRQIEHAKPQEVAAMFQNTNLQALLNRRDMIAYVLANAGGPMSEAQRRAMFARMRDGGASGGGKRTPYDDYKKYAYEHELDRIDRDLDENSNLDWGREMSREEFKSVLEVVDLCNMYNLVLYDRYRERVSALNNRDGFLDFLANASPMTDEQRKAMFARMGGGISGGGVGTPIYSAASGGGGSGGYSGPLSVRVSGGVNNNRTSNWVLSLTPEQFQEELKNDPDRLREAIADQMREGAYTGIQINGHDVDVDDIINYGIAPLKPAQVVVGSGKTDPLAGLTAQALNPGGSKFGSGNSKLQSAYHTLESGTTDTTSSFTPQTPSTPSNPQTPPADTPSSTPSTPSSSPEPTPEPSPTGGTDTNLDSQVGGVQQLLLSFGWDMTMGPDGRLRSLRNRLLRLGVLANAVGAMSDEQRKAMFARLRGGAGGGGGGGGVAYAYDGHGDTETNPLKAAFKGFFEGARQGAENDVNALSFGLTDKYGVTHSFENTGTANEISKGLATIGSLAAYSAFGAAAMGGAGIGLGAAAGLTDGGILEIGAKEGLEALQVYGKRQDGIDYVWNLSFDEATKLLDEALKLYPGPQPEPSPSLVGDAYDFMAELFENPGIASEFEYMTHLR